MHLFDRILESLFLVNVSGLKLMSSQTQLYAQFSTLIFLLQKMLFIEDSSFLVLRLFVRFLKTKVEYGFLQNPPVEETMNSVEH